MPDLVTVRRAVISVSDKSGVERFAKSLVAMGVEVVSTGGTARALGAAGVLTRPVEALTGFPEMLDGRVKTLHPMVHGGLLAVRDDRGHAAAMAEHGIVPIDLVCVNLYPFERTVAAGGVTDEEAIEQIDIGGPSMIRSGSKNHAYVAVVTDPAQYGAVLAEMEVTGGATSLALRRQLAGAAFAKTAAYDRAIARYFALGGTLGGAGGESATGERFPERLSVRFALHQRLRYGENPHQAAAVYREEGYVGPSVVGAEQMHGKELSYNNVNDAAAALELALALQAAAEGGVGAAVIKHANPCGAASGREAAAVVEAAMAGDPLAAYGGILATSGEVDEKAAALLVRKEVFLEVVVSRGFSAGALALLKERSANVRLLAFGAGEEGSKDASAGGARLTMRTFPGGMLVQEADSAAPTPGAWKHCAGPLPTAEQLRVGAAVEALVRAMSSNAVALGRPAGEGAMLVGGGVGQVDRVTACRLAVEKAGERARGAVAVSDAFFPFPDGPRVLVEAGVKMIVHPGGSKRDGETFALCAEHGVTCMTTGTRRFRH
jgi:phosphoribosylaminoimidazolecarboxamide formyltransferase/IMP cyclohydrolase